jgi:DeoR/GlpR family transcriptional regulator of sugar metabolism
MGKMSRSTNQGILPAKRRLKILDEIRKNNAVTVGEMVQLLGTSESTIRRDLGELSEKGLIDRTHGGAIAVGLNAVFEHNYSENKIKFIEEKERIGEAAARLVSDGEIIIIDSGSTTFQIAKHLASHRGLKIITNDISITSDIEYEQSNTLIVTGGVYRRGLNLLLGSWTENFLRNVRVNKAFIGVDAIDINDGVFNATMEEAEIKKIIVSVAKEVILVADHSKFGRIALAKICELDMIDKIITDSDLDTSYHSALKNLHISFSLV